MTNLASMFAAAALVAVPLAAQAQDHEREPSYGHDRHARSAMNHGYDAGAELTYSYPDEYGTYGPFAYDYSPSDDAYFAVGPDDDRADVDVYDAAPNVGWSAGGPPVDCGRWIWREGGGAYEWAPAPCPR